MSTIHPGLLRILGTGACKIKYLNLEKLTDHSLNTLSMVLSLNRSMQYLNLGRNFLTKGCVEYLVPIIERSKSLEELYIHWVGACLCRTRSMALLAKSSSRSWNPMTICWSWIIRTMRSTKAGNLWLPLWLERCSRTRLCCMWIFPLTTSRSPSRRRSLRA